MRKNLAFAIALAAGFGAAMFAFEGDANACGGCFGPPPPPTETPTVVTDHRMILTVSKQQSTLYDQIRYQGSPESFAWVLPISGTVDVGLSSDIVFSGLDALTQTVLQAPAQNCPTRPSNCQSPSFSAGASSDSAKENGGVTVLKKEIVGPYETVQLKADDPQALHVWLAKNGFVVPNDVKPVIDTYVGEKFNFLALKLIPGKDVKEMRPVRVTTQGANAVLPLRMVAAGTGPIVGISLWVVGEGRYEPQNFKSFYIKADELVWDWSANKSNYVDIRKTNNDASGGRAWETESSQTFSRQNFESYVSNGFVNSGNRNGGGNGGFEGPTSSEERAAQFYLAVKDEQGNVIKTASQALDEDMKALFQGIDVGSMRVTRLRADLAHAALDTDLVVSASSDQNQLPALRLITKEANQPICPVWNGCSQDGTAPRDEAIARSTSGDGDTFSCSSTTTKNNANAYLVVGLGIGAAAIANTIRRRRRDKNQRF